ncbi:MAG: hypothetical protein RLZZ518_1255, partial [Actinomycetota bacterium]
MVIRGAPGGQVRGARNTVVF